MSCGFCWRRSFRLVLGGIVVVGAAAVGFGDWEVIFGLVRVRGDLWWCVGATWSHAVAAAVFRGAEG